MSENTEQKVINDEVEQKTTNDVVEQKVINDEVEQKTTNEDSGAAGSTKKPEKIKFGPDNQGGYITPYKFTVVYRSSSMFETTVAYLCDQAQLIPVTDITDLDVVADSCEHPSPEILIFGDYFSREQLNKFFNRGFQFIHIFDYSGKSDKYNDENDPKKLFSDCVVVFGIDTLYEHIIIIQGLLPIYFLEYMTAATIPNYKSFINDKEINAITGKYLCYALKTSDEPLGKIIIGLCSTFKGFDIVKTLVIKGKTIFEEKERNANKKLEKGIYFKLYDKYPIYAIQGDEFLREIVDLSPAHPSVIKLKCDFVMIYSMEAHYVNSIIIPGWRIVLLAVGNSAPSAVQTLNELITDVTVGTYGTATSWVPTGIADVILPFIYPSNKTTTSTLQENVDRPENV